MTEKKRKPIAVCTPKFIACSILACLLGCSPPKTSNAQFQSFPPVLDQEMLRAPMMGPMTKELETKARIDYAEMLDAAYKQAGVQIQVKAGGRGCGDPEEEQRVLDLYSPLIVNHEDIPTGPSDLSARTLVAAREATKGNISDSLRRLNFHGIQIHGDKYYEPHRIRRDIGCE